MVEKNVGGRPRKSYDFEGLEFGEPKSTISVKMSDRKDVEAFCNRQIDELQSDFDEMKSDARAIVRCLRSQIEREAKDKGRVDKGVLDTFEKAQNRYRHLCKDQSAILAMLMKQFELFSALDRPMDDDPIFTPVTIVIDNDAPPEALVEPKFQLEEDDIDPQLR